MKLCIPADNLENITWWVDASYAVHWDSRSHTGMVMSFGLGAVMSGSWRQKLNTGSSTEAELVGIDDALKYIMWGLYFIQAQGFKVKKNILMQDNKSTILMAKNGRFSCSKRTKHIKNRYFMIKDKIGKGEIIIQYCPHITCRAVLNDNFSIQSPHNILECIVDSDKFRLSGTSCGQFLSPAPRHNSA